MKPPKYYRKFDYDKSLIPNKYIASIEQSISTIEEAKAKTGLSIGYPGWCLIYYTLLSHLNPSGHNLIVETGTNQGWTTIMLAQALRDSNSRGKIYTVELDNENYQIALAQFQQAGVADLIKAINGDSRTVLNEIVNKHDSIRAAFLDASHLFHDVIAEFEIILPALGPQSIVIFDNTYAIAEKHEDQRVNGALKEIVKRHGGNLVNLEFVSWYTPGIAIWQKSPFDSLKTIEANTKSKHNRNAKIFLSDRKKSQDDIMRHSQEELKLWEISKKLFSMVEYSDFKRALECIALIEKRIIGRHCGDLGDKLSQYLTIIQFFRESGVDSSDSLEIGTLFGGSCLLKLMAMKDLNVKGKIICIDPMGGYYGKNVDPYSGIEVSAEILFKNLDIFDINREAIELRRMPSNDSKATAEFIESSFATLMIDGDHSYQGVLYDWDKYSDFVNEAGFVIFDDYADSDWPDITKFVAELSCNLPHCWNLIGQIGTTFLIKKNANSIELELSLNSKHRKSSNGHRQERAAKISSLIDGRNKIDNTILMHASMPTSAPPQCESKTTYESTIPQVDVLTASDTLLAQYKDKHLGQRCIIIGNGPSLNKMDLSFLKNEITFGLNRIYLMFDEWNFNPTYYVSVNPLVIEQSIEEIKKVSSIKFISLSGLPYVKNPQDIIFLKSIYHPHFSKDPRKGIWEGYTVTYVAMQLAYFMGFNEVILIGVDHSFIAPGAPNDEVMSEGDDPNHFHPDYFGKGTRWNLPDLKNSELAYRYAKSSFENDGRRIVDATIDGKLQVFPKIDYKNLIRKYQKIDGIGKTNKSEISHLIEQGEVFFSKGQLQSAQQGFEKVLEISPKNATAFNNLGVLYYHQGDHTEASEYYKKAIEIQPENITFQKNLAEIKYVILGQVQEALQIYINILQAHPDDIEVLLGLGKICIDFEKFDDARGFLNRIIELDPSNVEAQHELHQLKCGKKDSSSEEGDSVSFVTDKDSSERYLVSAIVSTYNAERFIRGCLEDLENQTIVDRLEIVVVNSGSEQNEERIIKEFQKKYSNIKYIKTDNRETVYQAWNRGIKAASGKYITNANTDDRLRIDAYERMAGILANNPKIGVVYADQWISQSPNTKFYDCEKEEGLIWPEFFPELGVSVCTIGPQPMWRKDLHSKYGFFDENLKSAGDYEFWARISTKEEFYHVSDFLGVYYRNPRGLESSSGFNHQETILVRKSYNKEKNNNQRRHLLYSDLTGVFHKIQIYRNKSKGYTPKSDVSVVMPVYNGSDYIIETLQSIIDQTATNFEIIVVDDRSTDDSAKKAIRFLEGKDIPSTVMVIPHRGTGVARNIGVFYSAGEFILPFDTDDIMMPDMVEKFYGEIANNNKLGVVYCDVEYFENKHGIRNMGDFNVNNIMFQNQAHAPSMFRKDAWIDANGYCSNMRYGDEDWDLWLEMLEKHWEIAHFEKPLFRYRWREGSRTSSLVRNHWAEMKVQLILNHPGLYDQNYRKWAALENKYKQGTLSVREIMELLSLYINLPRWQSIYWWREAKKRVCSLIQAKKTIPEIDKMVENLNKIIDQNIKEKSHEDLKVEMPQGEDIVVSAIVSTYNSEEFIAGCLYNLQQQTISDKLEVIVVNSGLSQPEDKIIQEFVNAFENIKYIKCNKRETIYSSWNRAAAVAKGKYLVNTNTDDRLRRDALEIMANTLNDKNDVGVVYIDQIITEYPNESFEEHHTNGFLKRCEATREIMVQKNPCGPQVMWRRELLGKIGSFRSDYEVAGDWDYWLRVIFETDYTLWHIPELLGLYFYNLKGLEHGGRKQKERMKEINEIKEKYTKLYQASIQNTTPKFFSQSMNNVNYLFKEAGLKAPEPFRRGSKNTRNILLTTSAAPAQTPFSTTEKRAPIGIGFLISVLRDAGHNVFFIDNYLKPSEFLETDYLQTNDIEFVGIYANTICYRDTLRMLHKLEWFRQTGRWRGKIIVGGPHTTVCLDTIPDFVDFVVQGEGEKAIIDIVEGKVKERIVKYPRIKNLDELPMPAWDYFINMPYAWRGEFFPEGPVFSMNTSRGCPFSCQFCSVNSIWGKRYTYFSAERIVSDIEYLIKTYGAKGIYFREDNFTLNPNRLKKFCDLIIERGIKISWACETRVNALDEEVVALMVKSGVCGFYFGVESGSQKILNLLKKGIEVDETRKAFQLCHQYGIKTAASIVVGVPKETEVDLRKTFALVEEIKPTITWFNVFVGIPTSELYEYALTNKLYEFVDDRGLVYLKGHNQRVQAFYGGKWDAAIPFFRSDQPKISVVMSVLNGENYVESAIKSILAQTYSNFEYIIVDDASTDHTIEILKKYDDPRIKIISNSINLGLTKCLNKAISASKGEFIARMDADDISLPHRFEKQLDFFLKNPDYALVGSAYYRINEKDIICQLVNVLTDDKELKKGLKKQNWFGHGSVMMRRDAYLETGGYSAQFKYAQDYDLWLRMSEKFKVANIKEPLYYWRLTENSISHENEKEQRDYANLAVAESFRREKRTRDDQRIGSMISVIVTTFNRAEMLKSALRSILNQTYQNFEIVVVNDGGEDVSGLVENFQDPRVKYISHPKNKGLAAARNTGIRKASGQYIALLDDDDLFYPEHLETAANALSNQIPVVYTDAFRAAYERHGNNYHLIKKSIPYSIDFDRNKLLVGNLSPVNCFVFDKSLALKAGLFDETLSTLEDWDFWIRLSSLTSFKHIPDPTVQVNWRNDGTTMTSRLGAEFQKNRQKIYEKYLSEINQIPNVKEILNEFQKIWAEDWQMASGLTSIIILTRNQLQYTKKCIASIFQNTQNPYELIIVDNGSTDGTIEYLESEILKNRTDVRKKIIKNRGNKGFAGGNNQGIAAARGDYILLLNNDVVATPGWLGRMICCAEKRPEIGIVGPRSNYVSGPQLVEGVDYDTHTLNGLIEFSNNLAGDHAGQAQQILRVVGFCMLIKRAVIDKIGGMDDRYGLGNFEDDDFSLRATIAGFQSWIARDCFIHHFGNRTFIGEKVDLHKSLQKNWSIFKDKWGLPTAKPYGSPYHLSEMKNNRFDPSIHYYPLGNESVTIDLSANDAKTAETLYSTIQANLNSRSSEEVIEDLENFIASYPEFALAHNDLGILYYTAGNKKKALQFYEKATELDPENMVFQKNLADYYYVEMGRVEDALRIYVKILAANPQDVEILLITGHICVALERFQDAGVFYRRVLEFEPGNQDARQFLDKLNSMEAGHSAANTPEALYHEVQPLLNNGDPHRAIAALEGLLEKFPDYALAYNDLGVLCYHTGDKEKAQHYYERAVEMMPENINFQKNLADFYCLELGRIEEALNIYVGILTTHPRDIETLLATGQICVALERPGDAKEFYHRVLEMEPDNEDASNYLQMQDKQPTTNTLLPSESVNTVSVLTDKFESIDLEPDRSAAENRAATVSIIINLDGIQNCVKECIKSVMAHTPESHEILLINRGATKGLLKWVQQFIKDYDHYRIIECARQASRAESLNQGVQKAHGDIIVLMHNDVVVSGNWLKAFKMCINLVPDIGVVGPMSNRAEGIQQIITHDESGRVEFESAAQTFYEQYQYRRVTTRKLSNFCLAFPRELLDKIGYFDEQFVSEEVVIEDFCKRATSGGYQNLIAADTYVLHYNRHKAQGGTSVKNQANATDRKKYTEKWNGAQNPQVKAALTVQLLARAAELSQKGQIDPAVEVLLGGMGVQPEDPLVYLGLSEILLAAKRFQDAKDALTEMPPADENQEMRKAQLLAYAEEGLENYETAQTQIERVLLMNPGHAPALNLKGILAYRNDDNSLAEKYFKRAIDSDPGYGEPYTNLGMLSLATDRLQDALKFFEKAFRLSPTDLDIATNYHSYISATADFAKAEVLAREAAALYPNNQKIKYMLIDFLIQQGKNEMAMPEIEDAIIKFGTDNGIIDAAMKVREKLGPITIQKFSKKARVSVCMIIKDEEKYLARCLASVKPIVDEMIVVDTGSTDRSKDIAITFGARVYDYEWKKDFAAARNYSISQASGEWILILDGDEVISPLDHEDFSKLVKMTPRTPIAYSIVTRNYNKLANIVGWMPNDGKYPEEEAAIGWLPSEKVRLFYGKDHIWFEGPVHELVDPVLKRNGIEIKKSRIPVHHYGRLDKEKLDRKGEIYFDIGLKKLSEMGDDLNALRELAIQATILEKNQVAHELWQRLLALNPIPNLAAIAYVNMGTIYSRLGKFEDALDAGKKAIECDPDLKEARYNHAMAELHCGNASQTIHVLEGLLKEFPDYPPARFILSAAYCCADQKEKGFEGIRKLRNTPMGAHLDISCLELAQSLIAAGKMEYAVWVLGAAIESDIVNPQLLALFKECVNMKAASQNCSHMPQPPQANFQEAILENLPQ